ncbi:hypothetical protein Rsub_06080 [Raphidocelis subcapitata]|uniref:Uncharacterized protein n=1 Tax=Raphidocelis subcapitata TaxID=307507 RepID=A0A2V0P1J7_9CHLO|nr:hypothetical protein Rsub_06080 [Raphidocelis subcapitata]|eukprot:GBF93748.1 hypothetical protein Rsub_06080 [Raphidocelis subcapitata]
MASRASGRAAGAVLALLCLVRAVRAQQEVATLPAQTPLCQRLHDAGPSYHAAYLCLGVPQWALLPALWTPLAIQVNCTAPTYEIYTARTWEQLQTAPDAVRWCGLAHFASPDTCAFTLSPFEDVYVAIKTRRASLLGRIGATAPEPQCTFAARRDLSLTKVAMAVLGVALFTHARALTASSTFRLGAGALTFASGAALVLVFILMRSMPHKRKLVAALAVSASSVVGAMRWAYGTWAPDLAAIATSRAAITYFLVTGLLGLGITYWLDDQENVKLNTTVSAVLHLSGLLLVYLGTTSEPASLALVALLVASRLLAPLTARVPRGAAWLGARLGAAATAAAAAAGALSAAAAARAKARATDAGPVSARAPTPSKPRRRPVGRRMEGAGMLLSEDEAREAAQEERRLRREEEARLLRAQQLLQARAGGSGDGGVDGTGSGVFVKWGVNGAVQLQQYPFTEEEEEEPPQQQQQQQQQNAWRWPSSQGAEAKPAQAQPLEQQQQQQQQQQQHQQHWKAQAAVKQQQQPATVAPASGGWFSRWSNAALAPAAAPTAAASAPTAAASAPSAAPLHLRTPPPDPLARKPVVRPTSPPRGGARQLQQQQKQHQQQQQRPRKGPGPDTLGSSDDDGAPPARSPWSQERLVVDIRSPPSARRSTPASAARASGAAAARAQAAPQATPSPGGGDVSPLVAAGKIFNAESSRVIQIGKGKYDELVSKGYTPDFKNGVLLPPEGGGGGASGSGAGVQRTPPQRVARSRRG